MGTFRGIDWYTMRMKLFRHSHTASDSTVSDTTRMEIYSDAVIAIVITLLILDLEIPHITDTSLMGVLHSLRDITPHLIAFAFSFLTLSVFWVNHHHFFRELSRTDGSLLWYNNALLFWLALIPFTTAFLSTYPMVPGVLLVYNFVLFMAALTFLLMGRYALFSGCLLHTQISDGDKNSHFYHNLVGVVLYGAATLAAPFLPILSAIGMVIVPFYYIVPRMIHDHDDH